MVPDDQSRSPYRDSREPRNRWHSASAKRIPNTHWNRTGAAAASGTCGRIASSPARSRRAHLLAAMYYVDLNPVRAGITAEARDWRWSSARAHSSAQVHDELLDWSWLEVDGRRPARTVELHGLEINPSRSEAAGRTRSSEASHPTRRATGLGRVRQGSRSQSGPQTSCVDPRQATFGQACGRGSRTAMMLFGHLNVVCPLFEGQHLVTPTPAVNPICSKKLSAMA